MDAVLDYFAPAPPPPSMVHVEVWSLTISVVLLLSLFAMRMRTPFASAGAPLERSLTSVANVKRSTQWTRPLGLIHKSTFSVRDPAESCAFCVKYLACSEIPVPDPALIKRGVRWVRLPGGESSCSVQRGLSTVRLTERLPPSEFHFIPWGQDAELSLMGGIDRNGDGVVSGDEMQPITQKFIAELIDASDGDMKVWSVFCNTHIGWCVAELTSMVLALKADGVPFFGPTRRADGVYQLYVELPYLHYLEIDSLQYDDAQTGIEARPWSEVTGSAGCNEPALLD